MNKDKAGKSYWDRAWEDTPVLNAIDPRALGVNNYVNRKFHEYFQKVFSGMETGGKRLLEIGCAKSHWLPYFAKEFGFIITGLDYSEIGCLKAREILVNSGVTGEVVNADFFDPPENMLQFYDVVVSFGVVEHFEDTVDCLKTFKKFMKTGGVIISSIPNMTGVVGSLFNKLNIEVYETHVPLDVDMLRKAHILSGFGDVSCAYFLSNGFNIINLNGLNPQRTSTRVKALLVRNLSRASKVVWGIEDIVCAFPPSKLFSPFIICSGRITL